MATFYDALTESQQAWIVEQKIFFVASAPDAGRVNLSPKDMDRFAILGPDGVKDQWAKKNAVSMDGLEAFPLMDSEAD